MKNIILFNYNLDIDDIIKINDDVYSFYIDYNKFYFVKVKRVKEDIEEIYSILSSVINHYHIVLKNRFNNIYSEYNGSLYVLMKVDSRENFELDLSDILSNNIEVNPSKVKFINRTNWGTLWAEKIDYLEYQISELGKNHDLAVKSFSYYVGLAENAIEYYNLLKIDNVKTVLSQKRVMMPNTILNYYNPLNLVVDYKVRDIAEYIKSAFFNNYDIQTEIDILLNKNVLSPLEYNLLYIRLLYPSYYFDDLNKILEQNETDDILLKYVENTGKYERFLKEVYNKLSKKCKLTKIEWITKK